MTPIGKTARAVAIAGAVCVVGQLGIAPAAAFDEWAFSTCTATAALPPDGNFDGVATTCCVEHAGVPTDTHYGVGCVAPVANPAPDYRPTIYMPTRPAPAEGDDVALDELMKQPPAPFDDELPLP